MTGRPPLHGYNTNYRKKGVVYHVQTEDLGQPISALVTQVFTGGTILAKKRTEYKDILDEEDLESRLRELMQKQHKALLIALRDGTIDTSPGAQSLDEGKVGKSKPGPKFPTPMPVSAKGDPMRDTVQMELPPEFYEEIVQGAPEDDELIIDDFPPAETPIPTKAKPKPEKPAPQKLTPVPENAPAPTIRMTPPSIPQGKLPPPVPPAAKAASKAAAAQRRTPDASSQPDRPERTERTERTERPEPKRSAPSSMPAPKKPRIFAEISRPTPGLGEEQLGERSLDEVILSYLAEDLQDD